MLPALTLTFDPILRLGETVSVRWETIGLALVLFVGLLLAARVGSTTPAAAPGARQPEPPEPGSPEPEAREPHLRVDDFVFMLVGAVPGAIVGGRLGYVLDHLDYYKAIPAAILDPLQGGFTLTLAVPLGVLTGAVIARLLGASVGRWLDVVAPPLLFVLAAGKLVGVLGGTGQGAATDLAWATAYGGPGPWASLAADVSSHPSQVYEAVLVAVAVAVLFRLARSRRFPQRAGATFAAALGLWAIARFVVAFTLRDPIVAGPLRMEQVLLLGVLLVAALGLAHRPRVTVIEPEFEPPTSPWIGGDPDAERMRDAPGEDAGEVEPGPA